MEETSWQRLVWKENEQDRREGMVLVVGSHPCSAADLLGDSRELSASSVCTRRSLSFVKLKICNYTP